MSNCGSCASAKERCGNGLEQIYPTTAVRYGRMKNIGEFSHDPEMVFSCGGKVIISTDRGIELGDQVSLTCFGCDKSVSPDQMREYANISGGDTYKLNSGRILREANEGDLVEWQHIQDGLFDKIDTCRRFAGELGLEMKVVDCEHIFGGERIVFYFMAEDRVDFRELVRRLAREFQTRIEMKQVGARDEARLLADYETCGRECCCKSFLKSLKPVSMQMAKLQKATLDPSKVSGRCGRLKCCLRYEHESYDSLNRKLPRIGKRIRTDEIVGRVVDRQILTQLLKIRTDDDRIMAVYNDDVREIDVPEEARPQPQPRDQGQNGDSQPTGGDRRNNGNRRGGRGRERGPQQVRENQAEFGEQIEMNDAGEPKPATRDNPPPRAPAGEAKNQPQTQRTEADDNIGNRKETGDAQKKQQGPKRRNKQRRGRRPRSQRKKDSS